MVNLLFSEYVFDDRQRNLVMDLVNKLQQGFDLLAAGVALFLAIYEQEYERGLKSVWPKLKRVAEIAGVEVLGDIIHYRKRLWDFSQSGCQIEKAPLDKESQPLDHFINQINLKLPLLQQAGLLMDPFEDEEPVDVTGPVREMACKIVQLFDRRRAHQVTNFHLYFKAATWIAYQSFFYRVISYLLLKFYYLSFSSVDISHQNELRRPPIGTLLDFLKKTTENPDESIDQYVIVQVDVRYYRLLCMLDEMMEMMREHLRHPVWDGFVLAERVPIHLQDILNERKVKVALYAANKKGSF